MSEGGGHTARLHPVTAELAGFNGHQASEPSRKALRFSRSFSFYSQALAASLQRARGWPRTGARCYGGRLRWHRAEAAAAAAAAGGLRGCAGSSAGRGARLQRRPRLVARGPAGLRRVPVPPGSRRPRLPRPRALPAAVSRQRPAARRFGAARSKGTGAAAPPGGPGPARPGLVVRAPGCRRGPAGSRGEGAPAGAGPGPGRRRPCWGGRALPASPRVCGSPGRPPAAPPSAVRHGAGSSLLHLGGRAADKAWRELWVASFAQLSREEERAPRN